MVGGVTPGGFGVELDGSILWRLLVLDAFSNGRFGVSFIKLFRRFLGNDPTRVANATNGRCNFLYRYVSSLGGCMGVCGTCCGLFLGGGRRGGGGVVGLYRYMDLFYWVFRGLK